jgi:hypothetical protein
VTLGYFDHLRKFVTVPDSQSYHLGWIVREAWQPVDHEPEQQELEPRMFALHLTLLNFIPRIDIEDQGTPGIDTNSAMEKRTL